MTRTVILGAGFGGITAAVELRKLLFGDERITIVEERSDFLMGLAKLWALDGRRPIEAGRRPLSRLPSGIERIEGRIERIDLHERRVAVAGRSIPYDRLIVALGASLSPELVPGFAEGAHNLYDPGDIPSLAKELSSFRSGKILIAICALPFRCPPAPYEAAMLVSSLLERRGVRDAAEIELTTPEPRPLPVAPASCSSDLAKHLEERRISYTPGWKPRAIHGDAQEVEYENGSRKRYDLLVAVPPHRAPAAVRESGLSDETGWIPVDPRTLATRHEDVFAIGDVAFVPLPNGKPLPKAGVFAESQAKVVAANIAAKISGREPSAAFDGHGYCFIEVGAGAATKIEGNFFASPEPQLALHFPSPQALSEKQRFEAQRLRDWFGG